MRVVCREQRTHEWFEARMRKITASNIAKISKFLTRSSGDKKPGESTAERDKYIKALAWELIHGAPPQNYVSQAMDIGTQYEPEARIEYWQATGNEVDQTGFVLHPTLDFAGASPDGLIGEDGLVEIKVPLESTHRDYWIANVVPREYIPQMQFQMLCCERKWCDFVSYCPPEVYPHVREEFRLFIKRLMADPEEQARMTAACVSAMDEAAKLAIRLAEMCPAKEKRPAVSSAPLDARDDEFAYLDRIEMTP